MCKNTIHTICTFICLPCGKHHRIEIGVLEHLVSILPQDGTLEELLGTFPEVLAMVDNDPFQEWVVQQFIVEHGQHDLRFLTTVVLHMKNLIEQRSQHFEKTLQIYQLYRDVLKRLHVIQYETRTANKFFTSQVSFRSSTNTR